MSLTLHYEIAKPTYSKDLNQRGAHVFVILQATQLDTPQVCSGESHVVHLDTPQVCSGECHVVRTVCILLLILC